jgi:hypothetical protein
MYNICKKNPAAAAAAAEEFRKQHRIAGCED